MKRVLAWTLCVCGALVSLLPFSMLVGLGVHRHAEPWAITGSAMLLVFAPPLGLAVAASRDRSLLLGSAMFAWGVALFGVLPVYFPGERRQAVATGLAMVGIAPQRGLPQRIAESLPEEPTIASPEVAEAASLVVEPLPPAKVQLNDDQIALPYEGEGRRMSVPVIFANGDREIEVDMMFDTGATYTTLGVDVLARLGVVPSGSDPVIRLHTANGERDAQVMLLDAVWLGDLQLQGVAIARCDDCAGAGTAGLLGLNVAGGFNLAIDADRREVTFTRRKTFDRKLDVKPFIDLGATFTRFPGGRVEVQVQIENLARRSIHQAVTSIQCGGGQWTVAVADLAPGVRATERQRLPHHDACDQYQIALHEALW